MAGPPCWSKNVLESDSFVETHTKTVTCAKHPTNKIRTNVIGLELRDEEAREAHLSATLKSTGATSYADKAC
jgi:hypothetical protein